MEYRLESDDGDVTLESGAAAKLAGTNLFLNGQTGVVLGTEALTLAGLVAQTRADMTVSTPVTIKDVKDGVIDLSAGEGGNGVLHIDSKLTADIIDLRAAGVGDAAGGSASNIELDSGARFAGATDGFRPADALRDGPGRGPRSGRPADPGRLHRDYPRRPRPRAPLAGRPALAHGSRPRRRNGAEAGRQKRGEHPGLARPPLTRREGSADHQREHPYHHGRPHRGHRRSQRRRGRGHAERSRERLEPGEPGARRRERRAHDQRQDLEDHRRRRRAQVARQEKAISQSATSRLRTRAATSPSTRMALRRSGRSTRRARRWRAMPTIRSSA